jgi:AcrR family transcriptional regulator
VISQSISDKRKELLAAALRLFVQYGFHGTPTSKIAKEAGVANGTLFHYYNTKEDLIVSLYIDIKKRMGEYIEAKAASAKNAEDRFRIQFTEIILWSMDNKDEFYFIQQFHASPFAALLSPEVIKEQLSKSCQEIEEAIRKKIFKKRSTDFILSLVSSHVSGISQYLTKAKLSDSEQQKIINDGFAMLLTMLA